MSSRLMQAIGGLLLLPVVAACASVTVTDPAADRYCTEVSAVAARAAPLATLDLGSVPPAVPSGIESPRGLVLEPKLPSGSFAPDAQRITVPDTTQRKAVIIGQTSLSLPEMRRRFEQELQRAGLRVARNSGETRLSGKLTSLVFPYDGPDVHGNVRIDRCGGTSQVLISQTLVP